MNAVCSGFLSALVVGSQFIQNGAYRHVLVIGAETMSRIVDYTDRTTCILFGDGAGAAVLSRAEEPARASSTSPSPQTVKGPASPIAHARRAPPRPWRRSAPTPSHTSTKTGRAVFRVAVQGMADAVKTLLDRQGLSPGDLRVIVPHQANARIMDALAERLGIPSERVASCIAEYGNTSAATIPLALHKWHRTEGLRTGDYVMFTAFAGGLLWGAALWRWS